ncbi:hypothetical protein LLH00_05405 [bacterium]|nr:hypothetical protein [bacterium]
MTPKDRILRVLAGETPDRAVFAPNIWQWFEYHRRHGLPAELSGCTSQLDVMRVLGVDIFSRNLLTDITERLFGGHVHERFPGLEVEVTVEGDLTRKVYHTAAGDLSEVLWFDREGVTLVQKEYLFKDFEREYPAWKAWSEARELVFDPASFHALQSQVGEDGLVIAGEITNPLKQLHILARQDNAIFLLFDHEKQMQELMDIYAQKALALIGRMLEAGVRVVMCMDNLDSFFYPPEHLERYCASFFRRASELCHSRGAWLFSHACGRQRQIIEHVVGSGLDGLEGIAFPPLGDIELWEAKAAGKSFIVEGGLSATQLEGEVTQAQADTHVRELFERMRPFDRFIFSMSCNTSIATKWDTLKRYRDAWIKYGSS